MSEKEKDYIKVNIKSVEKLSEMSTKFHKLFSDIMAEYGKQEQTLFYKLLTYSSRLSTTLGIIAGFGFTAIANVQIFCLFILAETILLGGVVYSLWKIKYIYEGNLKSISQSRKKKFEVLSEKSKIFRDFIPKYMETFKSGKIEKSKLENFFEDIKNADTNLLKEFENKPEDIKDDKFLNYLILMLIVGMLSLVGSFI